MPDQVVDAVMARALHADACRDLPQINCHLGVGMVSIMPPPWITVLVPLPFGTMIDCPPPGLMLVALIGFRGGGSGWGSAEARSLI
jgi:hypothetical protein